ncbi:Hypothetical protein D9617_1g082570 [Elsinoe fawcettii]|nr:Hypothetical protein D9617_1g082570 [Elsinoe fawcettii]
MVNFKECARDFKSLCAAGNISAGHPWYFNGTPARIPKNPGAQITFQGCNELCGTAAEYYSFSEISSTITTWILPIMGIFAQGPYESNKALETVLTIARWAGSPIVSLSYVLWNVRVLGNCAMMGRSRSPQIKTKLTVAVDLSVGYNEPMLPRDIKALAASKSPKDIKKSEEANKVRAHFNDMRDSLYILGVMNQYTINRIKRTKDDADEYVTRRAEALLRIVLFSKDLKLDTHNMECAHHPPTLAQARHDLAKNLRRTRKRGIVPVFISMLWFIIALSLSIYTAFGDIGENATAHDLALGLLLGWLPVLILCTVVDRNPTDPEGNLAELNRLVESVARSFLDDDIFTEYCKYVMKYKYENARIQSQSVLKELLNIRLLCFAFAPKPLVTALDSRRRLDSACDAGTAGPEPPEAQPERTIGEVVRPNDDRVHPFSTTGILPTARTESGRALKFFGRFAGQGRKCWHYGVAHPILSSMEDAWVGDAEGESHGGRNWLMNEHQARANIVLGNTPDRVGFIWWDYRELWQILAAVLTVCLSCFSAFVLSYSTPTVGLGCRSGGYMIYAILSFLLLTIELIAWRVELKPTSQQEQDCANATKPDRQPECPQEVELNPVQQRGTSPPRDRPSPQDPNVSATLQGRRVNSGLELSLQEFRWMQSLITAGAAESHVAPRPADENSFDTAQSNDPDDTIVSFQQQAQPQPSENNPDRTIEAVNGPTDGATVDGCRQQDADSIVFHEFQPFCDRDWIRIFVLGPMECFNAAWLSYIVFAQTFGGYRSCECVTSSWGLGEKGYLDFDQEEKTQVPSLPFYWGIPTGVGSSVIACGLIYVVAEWLLQSHMNTSKEESARNGLRWVRGWRRATLPIRRAREGALRWLKYKFIWRLLRQLDVQVSEKQKATMRWSSTDGFEMARRSTTQAIQVAGARRASIPAFIHRLTSRD